MNILSIETSTKNFSLAVLKGDTILRYRNIRLGKVLSSSIIPEIKIILKKAEVSLSNLDGFAVGLGPGSFTSLRVGLSTVKAFAFASNKPIVGISSLDTLAMNVDRNWKGQICTICDAKRGLVYGCIYQRQGDQLKRKTQYLLVPLKEILKKLTIATYFIGDGLKMYQDEIIRYSQHTLKLKKKIFFVDERKCCPQASQLALLALPRFRKKKYDHIDRIVPLYLYPKDCQVRK